MWEVGPADFEHVLNMLLQLVLIETVFSRTIFLWSEPLNNHEEVEVSLAPIFLRHQLDLLLIWTQKLRNLCQIFQLLMVDHRLKKLDVPVVHAVFAPLVRLAHGEISSWVFVVAPTLFVRQLFNMKLVYNLKLLFNTYLVLLFFNSSIRVNFALILDLRLGALILRFSTSLLLDRLSILALSLNHAGINSII